MQGSVPKSEGKNREAAELAERLRQLRDERRISLRELSRRSGISVNALSAIERGLSSPSVSTLYRLVEALGVPITAIFGVPEQRDEIVFRTATERRRIPLPAGMWEGLGGEVFLRGPCLGWRAAPGGMDETDGAVQRLLPQILRGVPQES